MTLKVTIEQVVKTSVTVNNNGPIQDYVHPDDQTQPTFEMTPGFKPFTVSRYKNCYLARIHVASFKIIFNTRLNWLNPSIMFFRKAFLPQKCFNYSIGLSLLRFWPKIHRAHIPWCKVGLTTEYRANFSGIFVGAVQWLGSPDWRATEPPSH